MNKERNETRAIREWLAATSRPYESHRFRGREQYGHVTSDYEFPELAFNAFRGVDAVDVARLSTARLDELDRGCALMGAMCESFIREQEGGRFAYDIRDRTHTIRSGPKVSGYGVSQCDNPISVEHDGAIMTIVRVPCSDIKPLKTYYEDRGLSYHTFWYRHPPEQVNEKAYFLTTLAHVNANEKNKWPTTDRETLSKMRKLLEHTSESINMVIALIVSYELRHMKSAVKLWNKALKLYRKSKVSYSDLLDQMKATGPASAFTYKGYLIELDSQFSKTQTLQCNSASERGIMIKRYFSKESSMSLLRCGIRGEANEGDWPFGVGVEMTWSMSGESQSLSAFASDFARKHYKKYGFAYMDGDNLEFATNIVTSRARLSESYALASGISNLLGLPFDTENECGGGFHVNVSVDCSHPLHIPFAMYAGYIVSSMPWLGWCLNDAWDNLTARSLFMKNDYSAQHFAFGDKSSSAFFRGNRIEYRFMSMPRTIDEMHALVDLCMAITVKGKTQVLMNEPHCVPSALPHLKYGHDYYEDLDYARDVKTIFTPTMSEVKGWFNESAKFLGLDPKRFSSIIDRNLPDRLRNNRRMSKSSMYNHQGMA
jgi:hypothetical protein